MNNFDSKDSAALSDDLLLNDETLKTDLYCEVCFLAFGTEEPRFKSHNKTVHRDCLVRSE